MWGCATAVFRFKDYAALRPESAPAIEELHRLGIACHLISGDTSKAVNSIAYKPGISSSRTLAEESAERKLVLLDKIRARRQAVAFVGDGVTDAPAISHADVGVSLPPGH